MSNIEITPRVWAAEEHVAEAYRATHDDHLPATPFWLWVDAHYLLAEQTGNLARFEHWHGPEITTWEEQNYAPAPVLAPVPVVPVEPGVPVVPVVPVRPVIPKPQVAGSVPDPSSIGMIVVAVVLVCLFHRMIGIAPVLFCLFHRMKRQTRPGNGGEA